MILVNKKTVLQWWITSRTTLEKATLNDVCGSNLSSVYLENYTTTWKDLYAFMVKVGYYLVKS